MAHHQPIAVITRYDNLTGGYRPQIQADGTAIYCNQEDEKVLWYNSDKKAWTISDINKVNIHATSKPTTSASPEDAIFPGFTIRPIKKQNIDWEKEDHDNKFRDDAEFPAHSTTLGPKHDRQDIIWVRASRLSTLDNAPAPLFNKIEPNDIAQGSLGDCWLLAAASAMAEFPYFIKENLFETKETSPNGKYVLNLWHPLKKWIQVTIDDLIPCKRCEWWEERPRPIFAQPNGNETWVLLLERAFAKLAQGYDKLDGGHPILAWMCMTGCTDLTFWRRSASLWTESIACFEKNNFSFSKLSARSSNSLPVNGQALFESLLAYDRKHFLMGASIDGKVIERKRTDGLVERHAYTLLRVTTIEGVTLLQLRNPWGNATEWNGPWSDSSQEWDIYPNAASMLQYERNKDDGLFWMPFSIFASTFVDTIQVCKYSMLKDPSQVLDQVVPPAASSRKSTASILPLEQEISRFEVQEKDIRRQLAVITAERDVANSRLACLEAEVMRLEHRLASSAASRRPNLSLDRPHHCVLEQARRVYHEIMNGSSYQSGTYLNFNE